MLARHQDNLPQEHSTAWKPGVSSKPVYECSLSLHALADTGFLSVFMDKLVAAVWINDPEVFYLAKSVNSHIFCIIL